jgi:hypothetical protein
MLKCISCNFSCKKKGDWNRHIQTKKHINNSTEANNKETNELKQLILKQQEQIDIQQKQINELIPKLGSINQQFNVNIFLNDTCKDAMNWSEFIDLLQIQEITNIDNILQIICDELYSIGIYKRPIHCIDIKRKKICIKNKNVWEHNVNKVCETLNETANTLHHEYIKQWTQNHPKWYDNEQETDKYTQLISNLNVYKNTDSITKYICIPSLEVN